MCNGNDYAFVKASDVRVFWCKQNNYALEDFEPDLVGYEPQQIDLDRMTLKNENVPLVLTGLSPKNYRSYSEFCICRGCGKVYWQGTHWRRRMGQPATLPEESERQHVAEDDADSDDGIVFYDADSDL